VGVEFGGGFFLVGGENGAFEYAWILEAGTDTHHSGLNGCAKWILDSTTMLHDV
jgi:hypothetical protein